MYNIIKNVINGGRYNADEMVGKIDTMWVQGRITAEERLELIQMAYDNARDENQINIIEKVADLERRVFALENPEEPEVPGYVEWYSGYATSKGETVWYDYDKDGELELLRYDGGREQTALSPGKITGWHVVDAQGNILGSYYNGEFTPVNGEA